MEANNGSNNLDENGMISKFGQIENPSDKTLGAPTWVFSANKYEENGVENAHSDMDSNKNASEKGISLSVEVFGPPNSVEKGNKQAFGKNLESGGSFDYDKVENPSSKAPRKDDDMALGDTDKFRVGDLVWVLTKTKTWWPGQILDPSLLPNIPPKLDKNATLLVNYIGNNPMVWCSPNNLKPFMENFNDMSSQGKSKVFLSAVQKAVDIYENSAVKEETFPLNEKVLYEFEPVNFLNLVKALAWGDTNSGILELAKVKNQLSAFYRSLGHRQLPMNQLHETTDGNKRSAKRGKNKNLEAINSDNKDPLGFSEVKSEKAFESRERKKSKYLSYPYIDMPDTNDVAVSMSLVSPEKRCYITPKLTYEPKAAITQGDLDTPSVDLLSKLRISALDCDNPSEKRDFDLIDRFFYGFRKWTFHDLEMEQKLENGEKSKDEPKSQNKVNAPKRKRKKEEISTSFNGNNILERPIVVNSPENHISAYVCNDENKLKGGLVVKEPWITGLSNSSKCTPKVKKVKRNTKAPNIENQSTVIPDLNGNFNVTETNSAQNEVKKRRKRNKITSPKASLSPLFSSVFTNGESLGTALVLTFAEGFPVPSKEALIATFCGFGPLNDSETKGLSDRKSAQVVFRKGSDAIEALKGVEKRSPFGPVLVKYRLQQLLPAPKPIGLIKPCELKVVNKPKAAPDLAFMRKNLEMMTSKLEREGDNLSLEMRERLENEIKGLLKKVNAMVGSTSSS